VDEVRNGAQRRSTKPVTQLQTKSLCLELLEAHWGLDEPGDGDHFAM